MVKKLSAEERFPLLSLLGYLLDEGAGIDSSLVARSRDWR